jgi:hypothetical protein
VLGAVGRLLRAASAALRHGTGPFELYAHNDHWPRVRKTSPSPTESAQLNVDHTVTSLASQRV